MSISKRESFLMRQCRSSGLVTSDQYKWDDLYKYLRSKGYDDEILKETGLVDDR